MIRVLKQISARLALLVVRGYQLLLSPVFGPSCRFYPSCSEYTFQAIEQYGLLKGCRLGAKRLLRCHPLHPGGFDPLP